MYNYSRNSLILTPPLWRSAVGEYAYFYFEPTFVV